MEQRTLSPLPGLRLDKAVADATGLTRAAVQRLLEEGHVLVSGTPRPKHYLTREGDTVTITVPDARPADAQPEAIPLDIVYEDADLLVVNKPKGMVVHPAAGHRDGTLVNALLAHCAGALPGTSSLSGIGGVQRPGIVHRIDKDTSGLLLVAKNDFAHQSLAKQIAAHTFTRVYEAVVTGHPAPPSGAVDLPIIRDPQHRQRMAVVLNNNPPLDSLACAFPSTPGAEPIAASRAVQCSGRNPDGSRPAVTHYETLADYKGYAHLRLRLETGRTHQIRVHMKAIGHPVAGDTLYGARREVFPGQCLHAKTVGFVHPRTGEYREFSAPLPDYFTSFLKTLEA